MYLLECLAIKLFPNKQKGNPTLQSILQQPFQPHKILQVHQCPHPRTLCYPHRSRQHRHLAKVQESLEIEMSNHQQQHYDLKFQECQFRVQYLKTHFVNLTFAQDSLVHCLQTSKTNPFSFDFMSNTPKLQQF